MAKDKKSSVRRGELEEIIDVFAKTPVLVVGDLILDHYIWGDVDRISPEAPVPVVQVTEESKRPGGAGNVAHNLATLGAQVSLASAVGNDQPGRQLLAMLERLDIDVGGVVVDTSRPTTVKSRVIAHAQQVVRVDRETNEQLSQSYAESIARAAKQKLETARGVIVSDYAKGTITSQLFDVLRASSGIPILVDPKPPNYGMYRGATIIKPNRKEAEQFSRTRIKSRKDAIAAGHELRRVWGCEMVLLTLGEDGMVLVSGEGETGSSVEIDTIAREVYDVSGAGDTVSAVFSLALAVGARPRDAALLANCAAGIVVGEVGTVAISSDELREALAYLEIPA